jgi:hypothetical protein
VIRILRIRKNSATQKECSKGLMAYQLHSLPLL